MKRLLLLLALLCGGQALLPVRAAYAASPQFALSVQESRVIEIMGASAAWSTDASIVDVAAQNGRLTLFGRSAGATKIVVVSITGQSTFDVVVAPRAGSRVIVPKASANGGTAEVRYSSAEREVSNSVTIRRDEATKRTEISARITHAAEPAGERAKTSIPYASYRIFTRDRELTLLDRDVDHSPLTLSHTPVRGVHYLDEHWRVHAGVTAWAAYQSFLIPIDRQLIAGAGYAFRPGAHATLTPSLFAFRGEGTVASLLYGYDVPRRLSVRFETAYSRTLGGAAQVEYDGARDRVRADVRYRPDDFAVAAPGNPRGFFADGTWSRTYGRGSSGALTVSASDAADVRVLAANADVEHRLSDRLALLGGASWGSFDGAESITVPFGARVDFARGGFGAVARYATSETNRGGFGGRLFGRATIGRLHLSGSYDRQQNAPTLDLIYSERPDLALALAELGITASSASDIARALREHAILADLGFIEGVTVDLAPVRTQATFEAAWLGSSASRQQLRLRFVQSVTEGVSQRIETTIASLSYGRRLGASSDFFASYSWWKTERRGFDSDVRPIVEAGIRHRFDELPSLLAGSADITGVVFVDEDLDGRSDGKGVDAEVELDGARVEKTRSDGSFVFARVPRGNHRVTARVPAQPEAYFTTPSRVEVSSGERVAFGVATMPARLIGRVTNDAGSGIAGVRVILGRGATQLDATTDSEGAFAFSAAPGEWSLSFASDSVPAGYSLAELQTHDVQLDRATPLHVATVVRANRSVTGSGAAANALIEVPAMKRSVRADAEGRFALRSLPAGEVTIVAGGVEHRLVLPRDPATLTLDLATHEDAPPVRTIVSGERRDTMHWVVAIGAYRVRANAVEAAERARRSGVETNLAASGALTLVRTPPFASRDEAELAAARLIRAGLEAVLMSGK